MLRCAVAATLLAFLTGCGHGTAREVHSSDPRLDVLHAADLPRGYQEGDDTVCGLASASEGNRPRLDALFRAERPQACIIELERVWATPVGPRGVTSADLRLPR